MEIDIIEMPIYYGSGIYGVQKGPEYLRETGCDLCYANPVNVPYMADEDMYRDSDKVKYLSSVVEANCNLAEKVEASLKEGHFPIIVGGDHSLGLGSIAGISHITGPENLGVFWIDAHGDFNDENTSPSGNIHGMPLAASAGIGIKELTDLYFEGIKINPENIYIIGARDLDPGEIILLREAGVNLWTTQDILERGAEKIVAEAVDIAESRCFDHIHISFDIDVMDSELVPGTGTPVKGGIDEEQTMNIIRTIFETDKVKSFDFVEFNPELDVENITLNRCRYMFDRVITFIRGGRYV